MYITFYKPTMNVTVVPTKVEKQLSMFDMMMGVPDYEIQLTEQSSIDGYTKLTVKRDKDDLTGFFATHTDLNWYRLPQRPTWPASEAASHYSTFYIPKKSGGMRRIDAPDEGLKLYLRNLKQYFEDTLKVLPHEAAHAYVKQRCPKTSLQVHQKNESKWMEKLDFHGFFPSTTKAFVLKMLKEVYPIGFLIDDPQYKQELEAALDYAFLNNSLPQGTPLSPTLTNIMMVPIDYDIQHKLWDMHNFYIYTRYADDLCISSKYKFDPKDPEKTVKGILRKWGATFELNEDKTRFGSTSGRNWNLGIMLNKDNRLTIGHKQNQRFRAALHNLLEDYAHGGSWEYSDRMVLAGQISYYRSIDPEYTDEVVRRYEEKYNKSIKEILYA